MKTVTLPIEEYDSLIKDSKTLVMITGKNLAIMKRTWLGFRGEHEDIYLVGDAAKHELTEEIMNLQYEIQRLQEVEKPKFKKLFGKIYLLKS